MTLSPTEEEELVGCLKLLGSWGFGFTRKETKELVADFVRVNEIKNEFINGVPGEEWMALFESRHPDLTSRKPEQLKKTRVKAITNKEIFEDFFKLFQTLCTENNILNNPSRIQRR